MREPDPWPDAPPDLFTLSDGDLTELLDVARRNPAAFSDWQYEFCASCRVRLRYGDGLTEKQTRVLGTGLLYRLWLNDPDLWED